jgi:release factor glutamine methyltransferase
MNIKKALEHATQVLKESPSARLDAELLLAHILHVTRTFLYTHTTDALESTTWDAFQRAINARRDGHPIAYLTGKRDFWSFSLHVSPATLIPRPETELLVECVLTHFHDRKHLRILDLGTGSGAIALALALSNPTWEIVACDMSQEALDVAKKNAHELRVQNISFIQSNWFESIAHQSFDGIVSNPPYICENDPHLTQGDLRFEPTQALSSGPDGLDALTQIIKQAQSYLKPSGLLIMEHGYSQATAVSELLREAHYHTVHSWPDLQGHLRVTQGFSQASDTLSAILPV